MFPDLSSRYHPDLLAEREHVSTGGSFRERVRYDLVERPTYACGLLMAADMARYCGVSHITAVEFGVAEGNGLLNLCALAPQIEAETGVRISVIGFDTGAGLPELYDYRDHPEIWSVGDFAGVDRAALEARIAPHGRMVWGEIADTIPVEIAKLTADAPLGFVSLDVDLYHSTISAMRIFRAPATSLLPVVISYFDDTLGSPLRIGSLFRNRWSGQLGAIDDFNAQHEYRKVDTIRTLKARRPLSQELWLDQMYGLHVLDHPLRQVGAERPALKMGEHAAHDIMAWPL